MSDPAPEGPRVVVRVNGVTRALAAGTTVADLISDLGRGPRGIAVAVNLEVVSRSSWEAAVLREGDRVELLSAAQGG
jgi:sulfur carrier protein